MTKKSENSTLSPDRWLAFCILIGKMMLAGAFWLSWFALTWCFLFRVIEVNVATGLAWFVFLMSAAVASAW